MASLDSQRDLFDVRDEIACLNTANISPPLRISKRLPRHRNPPQRLGLRPNRTRDRGALMEQSGRNRRQSVANASLTDAAQLLAILCEYLHSLVENAAW
jgi:hypothetical protein